MKAVLWVAVILVLGFVLRVLLFPVRMAERAATVVEQQLDPALLLKRYEWFKDAAAALDQKQASTKVYQRRFEALKETYGDAPRAAWQRDDREQWNLWQSEVAGITASYNELAGQYNANMAKINYRFTNRGMLPQGATEPLPREYKPYMEGQ